MVLMNAVAVGVLFICVFVSRAASAVRSEDEVMRIQPQRRLELPYPYFAPLVENYGLENIDCNVSWTTYFGSGSNFSTEAKIAAGDCVKMEPDTPMALFLGGGLSVEGKLVIPDGRRVRVETPRVVVQGILEITSTKAPDGAPDVEFFLSASTDPAMTNYTPHTDDYGVCDIECTIGTKAFAVLGGQLKIKGLPADFPSWVPLADTFVDSYQPGAPFPATSSGIIVSDSVYGKWSLNGEVLITSHTYDPYDQQVRTISGIKRNGTAGIVEILLNDTIVSPISQARSMHFAVEVAYLSRNIRLDTAIDTIHTGGHLIVMNTPDVNQTIEGVEILHFGQQGQLGRYPIHFHFCHELPHSTISKNVVRQSNQRCIVAHATHYLKIEENVAYDTSGHCYLTEDGIEYGNEFRRNLGALTKRAEFAIPPIEGANNGIESDNLTVSTFWITNPNNTVDGNVAAGSEQTGFWLDLSDKIRGTMYEEYPDLNPEILPLAFFENNIAHSNDAVGFRTYPGNYLPAEEAVFRNLKSFRNKARGWFSHVDYNLVLEDCFFADNGIQVDFDRADNLTIRSSTVIGMSEVMRHVNAGQDLSFERCSDNDAGNYVIGVQMHGFNMFSTTVGNIVKDVNFAGFKDTDCNTAVLIQVDNGISFGSFESFHTLSENFMETGTTPMSLCRAADAGYVDIFIPDVDSTLNPTALPGTGTSMFISLTDQMKNFTDFSTNCEAFPTDCYAYCRDTCFGSVTFDINPADTHHIDIYICEDAVGGTCTLFEQHPVSSQTLVDPNAMQRRILRANLPTGKKYNATFLDDDGNATWPQIVETTYEVTPACDGGLAFDDITVIKPPLIAGECNELIPNGDVDGGSFGSDPTTHWIYRSGGADPAVGMGFDGGDALVTEGQVAQYLDERCFEGDFVGRSYEITAMVKLSTDRNTGAWYECNPAIEDCPQIGIIAYGDTFTSLVEPAATLVMRPPDANGYQKVEGVVDVTTKMRDAYGILLYIEKNRDGFSMFVDKVSMKLLPDTTPTCGNELVLNGDFSSGNTRYWRAYFANIGVYSFEPGRGGSNDTALMSSGHFAQTNIDPTCLVLGQRYEVVAKYRLFEKEYPHAQISIAQPDVQLIGNTSEIVARTTRAQTSDGWDILYGHFVADLMKTTAESLRLVFRKGSSYYNVIDDVSITPIQNGCDELIVNGDMEMGVGLFWVHNGGKVAQVEGYTGIGALSYDRRHAGQGMRYRGSGMGFVDYTCFSTSESFIVSAKIKLLNGEIGVHCGDGDEYDSSCPTLRIIDGVDGVNSNTDVSWGVAPALPDASGFQDFEYEYFPSDNLDYFELQWRSFPTNLDLLVDNVSIMPTALAEAQPSAMPSVSVAPSSLPSAFPSASMMPSESLDPIFWSILPNPQSPTRDNVGEYVAIKNPSLMTPINLTSRKYKVCRSRGPICVDLEGTLEPNGIFMLCRDETFYPNCDMDVNFGLHNRDPDTLELFKNDTFVEGVTYNTATGTYVGKCWERLSDGSWGFRSCTPL